MAKPRPQSIDSVKEQRKQQGKKCSTDDRVSDSAMMVEIRPTISEEQDDYINIRNISGEDAQRTGTGRKSLQTRLGRSQTDE